MNESGIARIAKTGFTTINHRTVVCVILWKNHLGGKIDESQNILTFKKSNNLFMPAQLTIKVTRDIIEFSKECGTKNNTEVIGQNCAVANALKNIFPAVMVTGHYIYPFGIDENNKLDELKIAMPKIAQDFIKVFDSLSAIHNIRLLLPEFEFDIVIPDEIISQINIDEIKKIVEEKPELHLRHNAIL